MTRRDFFARHGIVRSAIRQDLLHFGVPFVVVFIAGVVLSGRGLDVLPATLWGVVKRPLSLFALEAHRAVGLVLLVAGLSFEIAAAFTLGRFYASTLVIREDHRLITHGAYRVVRHPIYLGVLVACIGIAVLAASVPGLVAMVALIPIFLHRITLEERLLTEAFGDGYRKYVETTSKLIPFVY